jgi:hypothetical protein
MLNNFGSSYVITQSKERNTDRQKKGRERHRKTRNRETKEVIHSQINRKIDKHTHRNKTSIFFKLPNHVIK